MKQLGRGELILADGGYRDGGEFFETPSGLNTRDQAMKQVARTRHETFNSRIKKFKIMDDRYRGELSKHYLIFHALVNILQIEINCGYKLFQVNYDDKHN